MSNDQVPSLPEELRARMQVQGKRHALETVDLALRMTGLPPQEQAGIAVLATVLATKRVFAALEAAGKPFNRGQRHKVIRAMVEEFERKLKGEGQRSPDDDPQHDGIPRQADGRVDLDAANAANNPDVNHGGREEDDQDNEEGA